MEDIKYNPDKIKLFLDHCKFRWEGEVRYHPHSKDFIFNVHISIDNHLSLSMKREGKSLVTYFFPKRGKREAFVLKRSFDFPHTSPISFLSKVFSCYLSVYKNHALTIKGMILRDPQILRTIKDIPKWKEVRFLRSIEKQIQQGGEVTKKQREVIEKIQRNRRYANKPEVRARRSEILKSIQTSGVRISSWTEDFLENTISIVETDGFLSKNQKDIIAEKIVKFQSALPTSIQQVEEESYFWGPYVDDKIKGMK